MDEASITVPCPWRCGICRAVCAEDAVRYLPDDVSIASAACSKCMACVRSCPAGLIGEDSFD